MGPQQVCRLVSSTAVATSYPMAAQSVSASAPTVGDTVTVNGVVLTEACRVGLESNPDSGAVNIPKDASTAGVIRREFILETRANQAKANPYSLPEGTYFFHWEGDRIADLGEELGFDWSSFEDYNRFHRSRGYVG